MEKLISRILDSIKRNPHDFAAYEDLFALCRGIEKDTFALSHQTNAELRCLLAKVMPLATAIEDFFDLYKKTLLFDATHFLDPYFLYLEINRSPDKRFYQPRRKKLKRVVDALQRLVDDELDELFVEMPPRVGKTTLLLFFVTWLIGRNSERSNLYSAYSDTITNAFYGGVLEVIQDPVTYLWKDVFPKSKIASTNAKEEKINIDREKRYPSLTCRSLYGTLNGACDCDGVLISDDLIGGIEEALNPDRLISAWTKVDNNLIPRAKEGAKLLWCGTRWAIVDPAGKRESLLETEEEFKDHRFEKITMPALNEKDESNFDYDNGVGFSTAYYRQRRTSFEHNNDMASWNAQYQQTPIERSGILFDPDGFRYYNGELPPDEPDRIFIAVDPAYGGGDFVAAPVCFEYGDDIYVHDVVYDDNDKRITQPLIVQAVMKYSVQAMRFEATKSTESYADEVSEKLREKKYRCNITTKPAPTDKRKDNRIKDKAPDIREHMIFRKAGKRSKEYEAFMQNVFAFKILSKNKHDDAPDSLAMAMDMVQHPAGVAKVFQRRF